MRRLALLAVLAPLAVASIGEGGGAGLAKFEELWQSEDSWVRRSAFDALDPADRSTPKVLLKVLEEEDAVEADWWVRRAAIEKLAVVLERQKDARTLVEKAARAKKLVHLRADTAVALGLVAATTSSVTPTAATKESAAKRLDLLKELAQDPEVRAVDLLLETWEREKDPQTRLALECREHLVLLTRRDKGRDRPSWRAWWDAAKAKFRFDQELTEKERTELRESEEREASHRTVSREGGLGYRTRGKGATKLLVIPESDYGLDFYEPWFKPLEDQCEVFFVELPDVSAFDKKELKLYEKTGIPYYPVDKLVEAFEAVRKERKVDRFALCAFGFNSLVAQRYLTLHDENVSSCVLIGAISGDDAWGDIIGKAQALAGGQKDQELVKVARNHQIYPDGKHDYEPKNAEEKEALRRRWFTTLFADPLDFSLHALWKKASEKKEPGESISPEFSTLRQKQSPAPVLVQIGKRSIWTLDRDAARIRDHYPNGKLTVYEGSAMLPPLEETGRWIAELRQFLAGPPEKARR